MLHQYPIELVFRTISKKEFKNIYDLKNQKKISNMYVDYLDLVGKKEGMDLTTIDLYKIDQLVL